MTRMIHMTLATVGLMAGLSGTAHATVAPTSPETGPVLTTVQSAPQMQEARRGRGADDGAGHSRRGRGADDAPNHG